MPCQGCGVASDEGEVNGTPSHNPREAQQALARGWPWLCASRWRYRNPVSGTDTEARPPREGRQSASQAAASSLASR